MIATNISFAEYLDRYSADFCEWINGVVIKMSPVSTPHDRLSRFLVMIFFAYTSRYGGEVAQAPVVMRLPGKPSGREPDLQVLLPENADRYHRTYIDGPADLVVEIISPESVERDRGEKFAEYERDGVKEYWILDEQRKDAMFYVLNAEGVYERREPDADGVYHSAVLPRLYLPVEMLWRDPLPDYDETYQITRAILRD